MSISQLQVASSYHALVLTLKQFKGWKSIH